jgi:RimJ/RimL family protein N-acetyltransferase
MPDPIVLTGRHVRLEPLTLDHAEALVAAAGESRETYALTPVPADLAGARRYIEAALHDQAILAQLPFATFDLARGAVVGSTRFLDLQYWDDPGPGTTWRIPASPGATPSVAEIGYSWLAASAQRTYANTEAKLLMLTHAFETWGVRRVSLKTDVRNARSRAAIERLGARLDGVLRAQSPAVDGKIRDAAYYSIIAPEWPGVKAALTARLG